MNNEKMPRFYAAEIVQMKTKEERRDALAKVPEKFQDLVETHVRNTFALQAFKRKRDEWFRQR